MYTLPYKWSSGPGKNTKNQLHAPDFLYIYVDGVILFFN